MLLGLVIFSLGVIMGMKGVLNAQTPTELVAYLCVCLVLLGVGVGLVKEQ